MNELLMPTDVTMRFFKIKFYDLVCLPDDYCHVLFISCIPSVNKYKFMYISIINVVFGIG